MEQDVVLSARAYVRLPGPLTEAQQRAITAALVSVVQEALNDDELNGELWYAIEQVGKNFEEWNAEVVPLPAEHVSPEE